MPTARKLTPRIFPAGAAEVKFSTSAPTQPEHRQLLETSVFSGRDFRDFNADGALKASGATQIEFSHSEPAQPDHRDLAPGIQQADYVLARAEPKVSGRAAGAASLSNFAAVPMSQPEKSE